MSLLYLITEDKLEKCFYFILNMQLLQCKSSVVELKHYINFSRQFDHWLYEVLQVHIFWVEYKLNFLDRFHSFVRAASLCIL